jgi:hypothetical protein
MKPYRTKLMDKELELSQITPESRKQAAVVLEVLAGVRTPDQAAEALSISLPTYYNLETRALRGLIWSCTPEPPGRTLSLARKLRLAELKAATMEKQVQRYQALLRNAQRSVGLLPPPAPSKDTARGKRKPKKPAVRALRAIEALSRAQNPTTPAATTSPAAPVAQAG